MTEAEVRRVLAPHAVEIRSVKRTLEGMPAPAIAVSPRGSTKPGQRLLAEFAGERVWRLEVTDPRLATPEGARVGMSLRALSRIYGRGQILTGEGNTCVRFPRRVPTLSFCLAGGAKLENASRSWARLLRGNPRVERILVVKVS